SLCPPPRPVAEPGPLCRAGQGGRGSIMKVKLLVVHGRPRGKSLQFPHGEFVIGRGHECHVRPNSEWVSRQHCLLRVAADAVQLRALGSTNGTLVNGRRILADHALQNGDQVQVGPLVFEVLLEDALPAPPAPAASLPRDPRELHPDTAELRILETLSRADVAAPSHRAGPDSTLTPPSQPPRRPRSTPR